ncbi:peptidoglycan-binding protein [Maritalea porphyrae]|uniref:Peptidoglycan binding-like domain-containing protein n=1 Tax=Maritalea porphyrae TaxID=880732 RepID=A0ABQ5UT58_9HYPH|nr:peptidoglycan-binding protein [Maritalea porphyrae]GLQ17571.1 hypothetical protein GCM10007879_18200 [Maritalea porphyrae]
MPKSRPYPASAPSANQFGSASQPWDALKNELEDLLGQVQDQISEFEGEHVQEPQPKQSVARPMSAANDLEMRRQEALANVRSAVDRLGSKQEKPKKKKSKKKKRRHSENDLEAAIAQIRASTGQLERNAQPSARDQVQPEPFYQEPVREPAYAQDQNAAHIAELTGQIEGLHRSIRDLAGAVPNRDNFARIENQIAKLGAEIEDHKSPQALAIGDQLDGLQYALERLAELQVRQIGHIEQIKIHEANEETDERQQRIEESIRSIYEKFDTLEQSIEKPNGSIETIAKGIAGIARAVSDMQKRSENDQSQNILAQIENVSQRLSAMDNGQSGHLSEDVKREMQGLRGQLVSALEPRFTALETRLDEFATGSQVPGSASDYQDVTSRLEAMEDRITRAIEGIASVGPSIGSDENSSETFVILKAMEARLTDALEDLRDASSEVNSGSEVSLDALQAMEDRIAKAISGLPSAAQAPVADDQFDKLRSIESKLSNSLKRLEAMSAVELTAPKSVRAPVQPRPVEATVALQSEVEAIVPVAPAAKQTERSAQAVETRPTVAKSLPKKPEPEVAKPNAPQLQDAEAPPAPKSAFATSIDEISEPTPSKVAPKPATSNAATDGEKSAAQQSRESFIAAARRASVERHEGKSTPAGGGGLLGRALDRFKPKAKTEDELAQETVETPPKAKAKAEPAKVEHAEPKAKKPEVPAIEPKLKDEEQLDDADVRTLSVGPEPARPQSKSEAPRPRSALDEMSAAAGKKLDNADDDIAPESFLTRNRQPILLAASIVAIIAMTANLVLDNSQDVKDQGIPQSADVSSVGEAPRQISLTEVETALAEAQPMPTETAMTSATSMSEQQVALVAPTPQQIDTETVTASIPNSPVAVELPPTDLGPNALREAAANGDPRAQYEVGMIFAEGKAVPKDSQAAVKWFERSAASGFAAAQYRLGTAFEHGLGIQKDLDQAKLWYLRAAEAGNRMGMHNLAALYASGPDSDRDFSAAARWFEEAAKRGVLDSQFNLGMLYARGLGVGQDFAQSFKWFSIAAANGDKDAQKARDDVARSLDPAQMSDIKQELAAWQPTKIDLPSNFAPIGTWDKNFNPGPEIDQREVVLGVQIALSKLGFQLGTPDGVMGPKTRDAIRQFERQLGMSEIGQINPRLLTVLNGQPV